MYWSACLYLKFSNWLVCLSVFFCICLCLCPRICHCIGLPACTWSMAAGWRQTSLQRAWYTGSQEGQAPSKRVLFSPSPSSDEPRKLRTWLVTSGARVKSDLADLVMIMLTKENAERKMMMIRLTEESMEKKKITRYTCNGRTGKARPSLLMVEFFFVLSLCPSSISLLPSSDCCRCQRSLKHKSQWQCKNAEFAGNIETWKKD